MFRTFFNSILTWLGFDVRGIFRFHDGRQWKFADPWVVTRRLFAHSEFDWDRTPELLHQPDSQTQLEAVRLIALAVRDAFTISPFEQRGLSEQECVNLLIDFRQYLGDVKKNGSLWQTSPEPMESMPSVQPRFRAPKPDSDCGSTANANSSDERGASARAS